MSDDWYKRDTGAWLQVAQQLDHGEIGVLTMLTDMTHKLASWFVDDDKRVAGQLGISSRKWRPIKARLIEVGAVVIQDELVVIPALVQAMFEREMRSNRARTAGERGGIASAKARKANGLDEADAQPIRGEEIRGEEIEAFKEEVEE